MSFTATRRHLFSFTPEEALWNGRLSPRKDSVQRSSSNKKIVLTSTNNQARNQSAIAINRRGLPDDSFPDGSLPPSRRATPLLRNTAAMAFLAVVMVLAIPTLGRAQQQMATPVSEDKEYWYQQAQQQLNDVLEARLNAIKGPAKNVILFVGDGMGLTTITAGRILKGQKLGYTGEEYQLAFEKFPHIALAKTYTTDSQIGDSTGCATALMCGVKANVNTVGVDHRTKFEDCSESNSGQLPSLVDWAQKHGKSTGIVTNTRLTHGTPSALYAHSASRYWEDDSRMNPFSKQVCKDIARQLIEDEPGRNINVVLGGGRRHLLPANEADREERDQHGRRTDGRHLLDEWVHDKKQRGLHAEYVWNKGQFDQIDHRRTDYLLGVFGYSHLDFEVDRNKGPSGDPSLEEMTVKALQILQKNSKGFFLMVEGGRIDHAHHHNNARRALEEVVALDDAVAAALRHTSPTDTLVVVTADHSHVMTFGGDNPPRGNPITGFDESLSDMDSKPYTTLLYGNGPGYSHSTPSGRHNISTINPQDVNFVQQAAVPRK